MTPRRSSKRCPPPSGPPTTAPTTLQFTGHTYTETVNGKATEHTYAVTRLEKGTDTAGMEIDTAVFETDTGTHVIRYTCQTGTGEVTDTLSATLSSGTAFQLQDTDYVRQNPVQNITVEGLNDEITALLGGADTLTSELSKWCAAYYPTRLHGIVDRHRHHRLQREHHHHRVHPDHRGYRPRFRHRNRIRNLPPCGPAHTSSACDRRTQERTPMNNITITENIRIRQAAQVAAHGGDNRRRHCPRPAASRHGPRRGTGIPLDHRLRRESAENSSAP